MRRNLHWALIVAFTAPSGPVFAHANIAIPQRFQGAWRPQSEPCRGDSAERYDILADQIAEQEIDTYIRRLRATGNRLTVVVDEGYERDLKRRSLHFILRDGGKSMLVDGVPYKRCG